MSDEIDLDVLAESFAELLREEWPREKAIAFGLGDSLYADELWSLMSGLGWPALTAPEVSGGLGLGLGAAARLHHALGTAAAPVPMLGTTLSISLLSMAGSPAQQAAWLPGLADGSTRAAFAQQSDKPLITDGASVSGMAADVLDAPAATLLVLNAVHNGKPCWLIIPADAPGVSIERHLLADTSHTLGTVTFDAVAIDDDAIISRDPTAADELSRQACVLLAADSLGAGEAVLAVTLDYMKVREQFGKVIGSFQALKHRVADHSAVLVGAQALVEHAAALPVGDPKALLAALSAKAHVVGAAAEVARDCIQLHGGVGYTAEFSPHIYLKRCKLNEALHGTRIALLDRVAELLEAA
ncbi:MAG: acyl-CoA dehydrogenase family protein [Novosphingobium sp.]